MNSKILLSIFFIIMLLFFTKAFSQDEKSVSIFYKVSLNKYVEEKIEVNNEIFRLKTKTNNYIEIFENSNSHFNELFQQSTECFAMIHEKMNNDTIEFGFKKYRTIKFIDFNKSKITFLNLSNNDLNLFPIGLRDMRKLKYLDFGSSSFDSIPNEISNLTNLEVLLLDHTPIKSFPQSFTSLKKLKRLRVNYSAIVNKDEFLDILVRLPKLEIIEFWSVDSSYPLPVNFSKLKKLKEVSLVGSDFDLQSVFAHKGIEKLSLLLTTLTEIPSSIENLKKLKVLSIERSMQLKNLPIQLKELKDVTEFSLIKNLKYYDHEFNEEKVFEIISSWKNLEKLIIDNNFKRIYPFYKSKKLSYFEHKGDFQEMPDIKEIKLINKKMILEFGGHLHKCLELKKINPLIECK